MCNGEDVRNRQSLSQTIDEHSVMALIEQHLGSAQRNPSNCLFCPFSKRTRPQPVSFVPKIKETRHCLNFCSAPSGSLITFYIHLEGPTAS